MNLPNFLGILLIFLGVGAIIGVVYFNSAVSTQNRIFSPYTLLSSSWEKFKIRFIDQGRVIDYSQGDITTSEGQSYALLQAVWVDDQPVFDQVWRWTKDNMQRDQDHLFGWRWGKRADGSYGFADGGGDNSASDADVDITLALILAGRRWHQDQYLEEAKQILPDIWNLDTATVSGKPYLIAGSWAQSRTELIVNPSYFAPYAWRIFSAVDPDRPWNDLIDPAYALLTQVSTTPLDKSQAAGLPPDWVAINRTSGAITAPDIPNYTTNYSFDAMRVPWRIALDYQWYQEPQAQNYLALLALLGHHYTQTGTLSGGFTHDGQPLPTPENPAMYATSLGYFATVNQTLSQKIYREKIIHLYSNDTNSFRQDLPYYETSWLWFGSALYLKYLQPFNP